jgi:membrane protein implicated in regulation of membrane protease activity
MLSKIKYMIHSRGWSRKTVIRYILLQIPSFLLLTIILLFVRKPFNLPFWLVLLVLFLWISKDIVMFFFVWRAYFPSGGGDPTKMIGKNGIATEKLNHGGYIQIEGELWYAELNHKNKTVDKGDQIVVRESHGLTLFVDQVRKK